MFAIPSISLLILFIYLRPQEFIPTLQSVPLLYLFFGLALYGLVVDLKLRRTRPMASPMLPWVVAFFVWCIVTLVVREPSRIAGTGLSILVALILYFLVAHGIQSFRALGWPAGV